MVLVNLSCTEEVYVTTASDFQQSLIGILDGLGVRGSGLTYLVIVGRELTAPEVFEMIGTIMVDYHANGGSVNLVQVNDAGLHRIETMSGTIAGLIDMVQFHPYLLSIEMY
jgi:hypothetical protein